MESRDSNFSSTYCGPWPSADCDPPSCDDYSYSDDYSLDDYSSSEQ
jgi:hypothetical protein